MSHWNHRVVRKVHPGAKPRDGEVGMLWDSGVCKFKSINGKNIMTNLPVIIEEE